jgi:chromosome segregation ATPase
MNLVRYGLVLVSGLAFAFAQGCGGSSQQKPAAEKGQGQAVVSTLQDQLARAHDDIQREQARNEELVAQVQSLTEKLRQAQREPGKPGKVATQPPREARGERGTDESKIQLMGAKAIAEYRAAQLSRRLDALSKNLDRKEAEMAAIRQTAQSKEAEVGQLRQQIEKLQAGEKARTVELNSRVEQISKDLANRSAEAKKFKQELDEKSGLLDALKNAVTDASKLKSAAENEVTQLRAELAETTKQLETARNVAEQNKSVAEQWQQEAEQFRAKAEASDKELQSQAERAQAAEKELQTLKAQTEELSSRLQALEGEPGEAEAETEAEEASPSRIDRLLRGPKAQQKPGNESSLY